MNDREAFHQFIDQLEDALAAPGLHVVADDLPDELVPIALRRMQLLRARLSDPSVLPDV